MKYLLFCLCFFIAGFRMTIAQQTISGSFMHDGKLRTYSFYVAASYNASKPAPLLINLHGYTSDGIQQALNSGFMPIADTAGFIIAHPEGTKDFLGNRFWNYKILGVSVDDVGFLERLCDTISAKFNINQNRIYVAGMSNGGYMSYYLACTSDRFAAVGSVTGSMPTVLYDCNPSYVTPVIEMHGTADPTVPYDGNLTSKPIEDVVKYWVQKNKCNPVPTINEVSDIDKTDDATATHFVYTGGTDGHAVEFFKINNGGHTWPGSAFDSPLAGNTCRDFNAAKEIWRFFSQFEKNKGTAVYDRYGANCLSFYPNPASDFLIFKNTELLSSDIQISDVSGRIVCTILKQNTSAVTDISTLQPGIYFIKAESHEKVSIQKLVVVK